ncbi:amidohydrolase family protein [Aeromicrobium sp. 179-A 4D2 NHS]|uniref:amidohydrolase family protein n=1 Tax=Aeromicrobium sp. 179-A 4D2 NHS TaxID=3142375 RepID=UPI00399FFEFF
MYADHLLEPWIRHAVADLPGIEIFDDHTHVGTHDPSGFSATMTELREGLALVDGRAAVFPMAEPEGYRDANLACAAAAADSDGTLVSFARITPHEEPDKLLHEALEAGARGVKLHLSSDEFELDDPRLEGVLAEADERRLPVLVHAGPEVAEVGDVALEVCARHPGLHLVLAHCGLTDLAWIWEDLDDTPNLYFDTSWWGASHLMALFALVPPGRILHGSDLPYSTPGFATITTARCARQAGLDDAQRRSVLGGQLARLLDGQEPLDLGPAPRVEVHRPGPLLEVLYATLLCAVEPMQRGEVPGTMLSVAQHATKVPCDHPDEPVVASVARLLELYEQHHERLPRRNQYAPGWDLIMAAATVARTPAAGP